MIPILQPLPIDWSGKALHNRTKGEIHNLGPQADLPYRIIVMERGYFYTEDLFIIDSRGYVLNKDQDYQCIAVSRDVMDEVKKTACAVILITNPSVSNLVRVDAQMVGGRFCSLNKAILETAANVVMSANRKVYWKDLTDKPDDYRPSGHLHALWELYGFTEQTGIIKRMTTAMDKITAKDFQGLFDEFMIDFGSLESGLIDIEDRLTAHINDTNNPHNDDKLKVGLGEVVNAPVATEQEARFSGPTMRDAYTTPLRSKQVIETNFTTKLTEHINDVNNPHRDTAAKLGTLTNLEFRQLANQYYNKGETVAQTNRIGGRDFAVYTTYARTNVPINQITSGILPLTTYATPPGNADYILQPSATGNLVWRPYKQAIDQWIKKGNNILYAGTLDTNAELAVISFLTTALGVNHPNGTIAVYRVNQMWSIGTGNGSIRTTVSSTAMAVLLDRKWQLTPNAYQI